MSFRVANLWRPCLVETCSWGTNCIKGCVPTGCTLQVGLSGTQRGRTAPERSISEERDHKLGEQLLRHLRLTWTCWHHMSAKAQPAAPCSRSSLTMVWGPKNWEIGIDLWLSVAAGPLRHATPVGSVTALSSPPPQTTRSHNSVAAGSDKRQLPATIRPSYIWGILKIYSRENLVRQQTTN
jgi:hypothetical protein